MEKRTRNIKTNMWKLKLRYFLLLLSVLPHLLWAVKVRCKHAQGIREDHIHYCCKHPDGHNDITEACAKETGFKLPSPNEEALEDVTVEHVVAGTCWGVCVFKKFNFMRNHELDMNAVRTHYKEVHAQDPEYEQEMIAAFDHCHGKAEEAAADLMMNPLFRTADKGRWCDPKPSVILACVIHYFFHNCPGDRWAKTKECNETLAFAKRCKDALTTM